MERVKAGAKLPKLERKLISLDVEGNMATAKVLMISPRSKTYDYLSFLKTEKGWEIVSKMYHSYHK